MFCLLFVRCHRESVSYDLHESPMLTIDFSLVGDKQQKRLIEIRNVYENERQIEEADVGISRHGREENWVQLLRLSTYTRY